MPPPPHDRYRGVPSKDSVGQEEGQGPLQGLRGGAQRLSGD